MSEALIFMAIITVAVIFSVTLAIVVLRFTNVVAQLKRSESQDRAELMRELDQSHVAAFSNAMTALGTIQERIYSGQIEMFNKTMDMIHGPQTSPEPGVQYKVDDTRLDMGIPVEDMDDLFHDPTDDLEPDLQVREDRDNGFAVSVRPGESLVPHG